MKNFFKIMGLLLTIALSLTFIACPPNIEETKYDITISNIKNGIVEADKTSAAEGVSVTLTVTPAEGYILKTISVKDSNDNDVTLTSGSDNNTYTFTMPASNVTVSAFFSELKQINILNSNNGTISVDYSSATEGATVTITVTPAEEYALDTISVKDSNDNDVTLTRGSDNNTYTFTMPASFVTISATFFQSLSINEVSNADKSSSLSDYKILELTSENPSAKLMFHLSNPGRTYIIQTSDSQSSIKDSSKWGDGLFTVYDKEGKKIADTDDGEIRLACPENETTYYLEIKPYSNNGNTKYGKIAIYAYMQQATITNLSIDQSISLIAGSEKTLTLTYSGPDGYLSPEFTISESSTSGKSSISSLVDNKDGTATITITGRFPSENATKEFVIKDKISQLSTKFNVNVTLDTNTTYPSLNISENLSSNLSDYEMFDFTEDKQTFIYSAQLTSNTHYLFELSDSQSFSGKCDSLYWLYNSRGKCVCSKGDDNTFEFIPSESGTYYLVASPFLSRDDSKKKCGKAGFHVTKSEPISNLKFEQNEYKINAGAKVEIKTTFTQGKNSSTTFYVTSSNYQNDKFVANAAITETGNDYIILTIQAGKVGESIITLADRVYGLKTTCIVNVVPEDSNALGSTNVTEVSSASITNTPSTNLEDYTMARLTENKTAQVFKINLEAGSTYTFEFADSDIRTGLPSGFDAMFDFYDSNLTNIKSNDGSKTDYTYSITPEANGIYYLVITPYNLSTLTTDEKVAGFHIYKAGN